MLKIKKLRIEYRENPIGIDVKKPRFSWILESDGQNVCQERCRIIVKDGETEVWDSQDMLTGQSVLVEYGGEELKPVTEYTVLVSVSDDKGEAASCKGSFETGLLSIENYHGEWITHAPTQKDVPAVFFKNFKLKEKVKKARIYASALGIYELSLNGEKVGNQFFAPGWTSYHHRIQYQAYDITSYLKNENRLEITVANGWYKGILGFITGVNHYGDTAAAIAYIRITYDNGVTEIIGTDGSWKCTTGQTRFAEFYMGEIIDRTIGKQPEEEVRLYDYPKSVLTAQESEAVTVTERLQPVKTIITPKGETVLDFGQNMAGVISCRLCQKKGTSVKIRHAEVLDKEGNFYTDNLREAKSEDVFICSGEEETFMPRFTFHGFRYICIEGLEEPWEPEDFTACVLHTDMEPTGSFECSHKEVTRLQKNIEWGQRSNFLDIPTDCPQRDERLGWTGDAQVFAGTASYNYNTALFFAKWLRDLKAEQTKEYGVPHIIPNILGNKEGATGWGDAATVIPWTMYLVYGDKRILEEQYESMKDWVEYIRSKAGDSNLWQQGFQYGDWVALDKEEGTDVGATDVYLIATAYYAYSTEILVNAAKVLGFMEDAKEYEELHSRIVKSFRDEYITKTGRLVSETQTGCVLALHFGLAEETCRPRILKSLLQNLARHKNHLVTGFLGTPYLCHVLSENEAHEIAGKLLLQEDYPSWLYEVKMGATTIWERWNSLMPDGSIDESGMNSFNHYAYGAIGDWMYQRIAGIRLLEPGYKKSRIAPEFIRGITWAKGSLETVYGTLSCAWSCENKKIKVDIVIPANTTATIKLPEKEEELELGSGVYQYCYDTETVLEKDKYSMESTLKQILAQPQAVEMLEAMSPGMTENKMIKLAYGMSISELCTQMPPEGVQMFEAVINALNKKI